MSDKAMIWLFVFIGSALGSWLPVLFGADWFSLWSIVLSTIGALAGLWVGYLLIRN